MKQIKGPAIFLAQFVSDQAPFNSFSGICQWASSLGYKAIQLPSWDARLFDLKKAAESQDYCDEIAGIAAEYGLTISELSTHLQGQLVAVHLHTIKCLMALCQHPLPELHKQKCSGQPNSLCWQPAPVPSWA